MKKYGMFLIGLFMLIFLISGCNSDKKEEKEMTIIIDTMTEIESNQYYFHLIESLLANELESELLNPALDELNTSTDELMSLPIKTKKGKEVINHYQDALENREKVISILKKNDFTKETIKNLKKYIIKSEESESAATEIVIDELELKDIEK